MLLGYVKLFVLGLPGLPIMQKSKNSKGMPKSHSNDKIKRSHAKVDYDKISLNQQTLNMFCFSLQVSSLELKQTQFVLGSCVSPVSSRRALILDNVFLQSYLPTSNSASD